LAQHSEWVSGANHMQIRLLGPVDIVGDGTALPVAGRRRKAVLAALALQPMQVVSTGLLIEIVWGDTPPATAGNTLQSHVSYLRRALGGSGAIRARPPGYCLAVANDATDVQTAERLIRQGIQCVDPRQGAGWLQTAVDLWRGPPLADLGDLPWFDDHARRLEQLHLHAQQSLMQARLALGQHAQLVTELESLRERHPLNEEIHGLLILALYRSGRQADALAAYQALRHSLDEELGIDPSPPLRELHAAILHQDSSLDPPPVSASTGAAPARPPVPAQLPLAIASFTGRSSELTRLDELLPGTAAASPERGGAAVVSAVSGTAGVGKTALAVHWAHRVRESFPDGQLYANLHGFDPGGRVADPAEVMRGFLDALGVPAERVPTSLEAKAGLYRSLLAGKRVLVVLDNARDAAQVRPLLPGSTGCLVVVTSRNRLTGLAATEGAHALSLERLTAAEARDLLVCRLGVDRVAAEPDAAHEIIERCARLPLALAIAAARAVTRPDFPLAALAGELADTAGGLDTFRGDEPATDVRTVFSWSYRAVGADAATLFRLLGLHPGPNITLLAAASLTGMHPRRVRVLLAELTGAHLLTEPLPGRYAFHDLLRTYAAELAAAHDSDEDRHAALQRILEHYLHTAFRAHRYLRPMSEPIVLASPLVGVVPESAATEAQALGWFRAEHPTLLAAVDQAAQKGLDTHAWQLAWTLNTFLLRRGVWEEQRSVQKTGLLAARRLGDQFAVAHTSYALATGYARSGRFDAAAPLLREALGLFEQLNDQANQAWVLGNCAWVSERQDRPADALEQTLRGHQLFRAIGDLAGQAKALNDIGWCHALLGNLDQALDSCEQALAEIRALGDRNAEAATWDSLGYIHRLRGDYRRAFACYQSAVDLYRELTDRYNEADTLGSLGDIHHAAGNRGAAREAWEQALHIFNQLHHPDAHQVRTKLHDLHTWQTTSPSSF